MSFMTKFASASNHLKPKICHCLDLRISLFHHDAPPCFYSSLKWMNQKVDLWPFAFLVATEVEGEVRGIQLVAMCRLTARCH